MVRSHWAHLNRSTSRNTKSRATIDRTMYCNVYQLTPLPSPVLNACAKPPPHAQPIIELLLIYSPSSHCRTSKSGQLVLLCAARAKRKNGEAPKKKCVYVIFGAANFDRVWIIHCISEICYAYFELSPFFGPKKKSTARNEAICLGSIDT